MRHDRKNKNLSRDLKTADHENLNEKESSEMEVHSVMTMTKSCW